MSCKRLDIVVCYELVTDEKKEELLRDSSLFLFYCPDSDLSYFLRVEKDPDQTELEYFLQQRRTEQ